MNQYTIYCTPEQACKALELGAKIITEPNCIHTLSQFRGVYNDGETFFHLPTIEQMIGWLEEKGMFVIVHRIKNVDETFTYYYDIFDNDNENICDGMWTFLSREEATLAAICAALDYLIENKGE